MIQIRIVGDFVEPPYHGRHIQIRIHDGDQPFECLRGGLSGTISIFRTAELNIRISPRERKELWEVSLQRRMSNGWERHCGYIEFSSKPSIEEAIRAFFKEEPIQIIDERPKKS